MGKEKISTFVPGKFYWMISRKMADIWDTKTPYSDFRFRIRSHEALIALKLPSNEGNTQNKIERKKTKPNEQRGKYSKTK